ncbi:Cof-type HAD-IIB family hydrolase [Exiguobacterium undae]|uniref:Cof-type HAD-IIB family hydrolase n=1 Tax=Exiguobacterium undae TaxID=169177 RepID=A0ABX2V513_9BACL|nr:Cof-type HAD-IIB family hydrolase [Exiguobacterium undae]OAN10122.1 hypothetical protein A3783_15270 [Exiguobacterium undae]
MKLFAIDLDGTLLKSDHTISAENVSAIKKRQKDGDIILIATGRASFDAQNILRKHHIHGCPIIASNGAELQYKVNENSIRSSTSIDPQTSEKIFRYLNEEELYIQVYLEDKILLESDATDTLLSRATNEKVLNRSFSYDTFIHSIQAQLEQYGVHPIDLITKNDLSKVIKFMIVSPNQSLLKKVERRLSMINSCSISSSGAYNLEVMSAGISKGEALKKVTSDYEIELRDTIAIGDNQNDLSMFQVAGSSIAMKNADESIKNIATYETLDHNHNGVANALNDYPSNLIERLKRVNI